MTQNAALLPYCEEAVSHTAEPINYTEKNGDNIYCANNPTMVGERKQARSNREPHKWNTAT